MIDSAKIPHCEIGLARLVGEINNRPLDPDEDSALIDLAKSFTTYDSDRTTTLKCNVGACMLDCAFAKQVDAQTGLTTYHQLTALGRRLCVEPRLGE
jgi:hypothetical protein